MTQPVTSDINCMKTDCAIAGGGPAGLMLGLLLARSGVNVTVLEKHQDFLRDFRGDTIHPSTLQIMHELGLLDGLLALPHTKAYRLHAEIGGQDITIADFSKIPAQCHFIAFMPQWEFLNYIAREAAKYPNFKLVMPASVVELIERDGNVTGLVAATPDGTINISAKLVVGADGRNSVVRAKAGMEIESFGSPSEILWMKLSHLPNDPPYTMGHGGPRQGFVMIDRGDYWQCGYVLRKQTFTEVKQKGLEAFREAVANVSPLPPERMDEIRTWDDVHLLSVRIDRLKTWWKPGLLCIGDAAHAMSPIGGFGVNLAIQDAVAAANILAGPLKGNGASSRHLAGVEARRRFPTKATQKLQLMMRSDRRRRETNDTRKDGPPAFMRHLARWPILAHLAGRLIGIGFRPEHVRDN
ncbi:MULTISPECIES: FAD-dependent oxidoreductase [unclassified Ochrobactrum]|uniref:FAD-dependent oxidoreductase n=1 Tax=unclassified Ochrobactrum TaxID=239106 RepID=UPI000DEF3C4A|nr:MULTISPECIES: FAD-dependent oxidoreductase [unclassified Ochrobactrum]MBQ0710082.1 FAD-dependent oxidoreductase [Ochrobactrum sp. AP1BH01-1]